MADLRELRDRLAGAWEIICWGRDEYEIGRPVLDADGVPMRRCTACGLPRGTARHAARCSAGLCDDPDAGRSVRCYSPQSSSS